MLRWSLTSVWTLIPLHSLYAFLISGHRESVIHSEGKFLTATRIQLYDEVSNDIAMVDVQMHEYIVEND